jgi:membrane-bound lytic murein transglycosylase D
MLGGCGSSATVVKSEARPAGGITNALSRALAFATEKKDNSSNKKIHPSKVTSYPSLPDDSDDPRARRFIREYAYEQRDTMKQYLARAEEYLPMVQEICREHGVPEDMAYLFILESGANPEARSPANALGMWQFMPATARNYGLRVDSHVDERLDPSKSTEAAMLYLKDLYGMFGCWRLALSAYNSGENKLNRVLCAEDASEYDEVCSSRKLKRETREFFPRFQAVAMIAKNPKKFGFAPLNLKPPEKDFELVQVDGSYRLEDLAWAAGVPCQEVVDLNPALFRGVTPPDGTQYGIRVPKGKKTVMASKLKEISEEDDSEHTVHVVDRGDSISRILKRYRINRAQLVDLNPDVNLRRALPRGAKLLVPVTKKTPAKKSRNREELSMLK